MQQQDTVGRQTSASAVEPTSANSAESDATLRSSDSLRSTSGQIFSRKKSLLTVGQYARRQGVSAGIVQECARLGMVQVRKHRDKTFVVDLPMDIYKIIKELKEQDSQSLDHVDTSSSAEKTTGLVLSPPCDPAATDGIFQSLVELSFPLPQDKEPAEIVPVENENPVPIDKFRVPVLRGMTEYIKSSAWKLFFVLTAAAFAVSLCAYVWVNMDRKMQQEKLQQTYVSFNKLITKYEEAKNQAKLYEVDMMTWRLEAQRSKNALMNSETELQNTRKNLFEVKKELENVRRENTEALKELNDKITSIREHIPAVAEQPAQ